MISFLNNAISEILGDILKEQEAPRYSGASVQRSTPPFLVNSILPRPLGAVHIMACCQKAEHLGISSLSRLSVCPVSKMGPAWNRRGAVGRQGPEGIPSPSDHQQTSAPS